MFLILIYGTNTENKGEKMEKLVEINNVYKRYKKKNALSDVSMQIDEGQIIGLLGPNGSGKTTLIKILNHVIADYEGEIKVEGQPIGVHSKGIISYLPDEPYFSKWMKGKDVISIFRDFYQDFDEEKCHRLLTRFQINESMSFRSMSKGMKEKFQLSLVMARKSKLLILDEPIGGVDPAARELILDTILENKEENQTIILSTHLIADIERIFDRVIFLKEGRVVLNESTKDVYARTNQTIDELFREEFRCY